MTTRLKNTCRKNPKICFKEIRHNEIMRIRFTSKEFNQLGLELSGFSPKTIGRNARCMNLERFKDFFYASPKTVESLFEDIQHQDLGAARKAQNFKNDQFIDKFLIFSN